MYLREAKVCLIIKVRDKKIRFEFLVKLHIINYMWFTQLKIQILIKLITKIKTSTASLLEINNKKINK